MAPTHNTEANKRLQAIADHLCDEEWRPIPGWDEIYEVSSIGQVRSIDRLRVFPSGRTRRLKGRVLKPSFTPSGYLSVCLSCGPERPNTTITTHRLVALAFLAAPDCETKITVNHIDGNKLNNCPSNLEWVSRSENSKHGWSTGLMVKSPKGAKNCRAKLTEKQADEIRRADLSLYGSKIALAARLGVSTGTITSIQKGLRYAL